MTAAPERREHWDAVYAQKAPNQVSWFQSTPEPSLGLIKRYAGTAASAPDGPEKCSGLAVARHDAASLSRILGPSFDCLNTQSHNHETPWQTPQAFQFSVFRKVE